MIEFPIPNEISRTSIFKIHSRKLNISKDVNIKKLVDLTDKSTGADIRAICNEAGMFAIRRESEVILQEDFISAIKKVLKKNKNQPSESKLFI
jgi:ATP-dependent 26S proteasome regulatory subunit